MNSIDSTSQAQMNLNRSLRENLERDPDYQIVRRMMLHEEVSKTELNTTQTVHKASPSIAIQPEQISRDQIDREQQARAEQVLQQATARFEASLQTSRRMELRVEARNDEIKQSDPLVLDLGGNGFQTTGLEQGTRFDINGDGRKEQVSVPTGDDYLLAIDRNNNGRIDDGTELFGDQNGSANGFEELAKYDDNKDGRIDSQDRIFEQLRLVQLQNQQQQSLSEAGIKSLNLGYTNQSQAVGQYDTMAQLGEFERLSGETGSMADLLLANRSAG
ncbi:MAG: hypothetical protein CMF25_06890 [Kangiellaceae bacterium]|nr:hypothetical protein [Kangiellaceae bacterium]|tara:strand:+ start:104 stop:925 length:822 start_codon:yes stop_codon:yes gene_type:complete